MGRSGVSNTDDQREKRPLVYGLESNENESHLTMLIYWSHPRLGFGCLYVAVGGGCGVLGTTVHGLALDTADHITSDLDVVILGYMSA